MVIRWDSESDWQNEQDSSGAVGRNGNLKQGYSRERPDLSSSLIGYWPLHDNSATDYSGNGNHGSLTGGVTTGVAGKGGLQAMDFNNNDSWVDYGFSNHYSEGSMAFWFRARSLPSNDGEDHPLMGNGGTGEQCRTSVNENDKIVFNRQSGGNSKTVESSAISTDKWYFVVATWNDSENRIRLYIDGNRVGSNDSPGLPGSSDGWRFGRQTRNASGERYHNGAGCLNRLYDRELTETEVEQLYRWGSGDFSKPEDNGTSYYALDGDGTDSWGANEATINGGSWIEGIRGQAISLDGDNDYVDTKMSPFGGNSELSISFWIRRTGSLYRLISRYTGGSTGWLIDSYSDSSSQDDGIRFYNEENVVATTISWDNTWRHFVVVFNSGRATVYQNGAFEATGTGSNTTIQEQYANITIGARSDGEQFSSADIDDVRFYPYALNPRQVFELYRYGTRGRDMRKQLVNY